MNISTTTRQPVSNRRHQYVTEHRILSMIIVGIGFFMSFSGPPAWAQLLCPLPAANPWCTARQPMDCQTTATNETCLPREIMFPSPTAPPTILLCDCFTDVPDCGPVDIQPNPIPPGGYTVSCPGPCPPGQVCELHFNGISQGVSSIDSSQIPAGQIVSCGCVIPPPPPVCPVVGNSWCVGLQSTDCNTTTINETCLPREVTIDPLTGEPIILLCDCFTIVAECGPVDIVPNTPTGYTVSCPGPCPSPQVCQVHFNGAPTGMSSVDTSTMLPPYPVMTCACATQPPPPCPLPANAECAARQSIDCQSTAGECLPKVIRHHIPAVVAFFPPAGTDLLRSTTGYVAIQTPPPNSIIEYYYIRESPPNLTQVLRESPTVVGDHRIITTEILAMDLVGVSGGGGGGGAVRIRESPTLSSNGRVTGAVGGLTDYPADSFFDLFVEIDIPGYGVTGLYNDELTPIPLNAPGIRAVPPLGKSFRTPQGWQGVELLIADGFPTGYVIVEVVHELPPPDPPEWEVILCACVDPSYCHVTRDFTVDPTCTGGCPAGHECVQRITTGQNAVDYTCECVPLGACCYAAPSGLNSLCTETTQSNCVNILHGAYEGDGTVCGGTAACCLSGGGCLDADGICCALELGGHSSPIQAQACLDDPSGNGIDDACETLDRVVCEPQGLQNPTHPNVYWYDVTPQGWGRCDFHVLLVDTNAANYSAWTINPWPGNTWQFTVHPVGTETWASWYTPNCAEPMSPGTTYRLQFNHNGASAWSHWRTTYTGNNDPYDPLTFDRSQNHPGEPDGYGYRVHVPQPPTGPTEACCLWDGSCVELPRQQCCDIHGTPQGTGTNCATTTCPPPDPIDVGMNIDVHQDNPDVVANDFHIEGMIESGRLPVLVEHIDDLFPNFTYSIVEDPPGNGLWYKFTADWTGHDYAYCQILHLGLKFKVVCHNVMIDLIGWWTKDGVRVGAATTVAGIVAQPGYWPVLGFDVEDNIRVQPQPEPPDARGQHIRIQSGDGHAPAEPGEFSVEVVQMDLIALTTPFPLAQLRLGGDQEQLPWVEVLHYQGGPPVSLSFPIVIVPDSFFDVFFELPQPGQPTTATAITIPPGGYLLARQLVRFTGNGIPPPTEGVASAQAAVEYRWFWEMHGAHRIPQPEACCMPDGSCQFLLPSDCVCNDGTPQGLGTACSMIPSACCLPDGTCREVDPLCCDDIGGTLPPNGATLCANADCPSPNVIVWNPAKSCNAGSNINKPCATDADCPPGTPLGICDEWPNTNPEATTRSLRFTVTGPAGPSKPEAIKITMVDLQHPRPANLPAQPPPNYTTYDTRLNGVCNGGTLVGHHCDADADCPPLPVVVGRCSSMVTCTAAGEANRCARWVGKPGIFLENQDAAGGATYKAARLQCTPLYWDWKLEGLITVVGAEIVPSSEYSGEVYGASCMGTEATCTDVSPAVTMYTRRSGDAAPNFNPPSTTGQPDALDVAAVVNKLKNLPGALVKAITQLQPNLPELNANVNALDIVAVVDGVRQIKYAFSGPCVCPSAVTCGGACGTGCPAPNMCVKTCTGGTNDGQPCIDSTRHCPGGTCGTPLCRDRCGRCTP